MLKISVFLICFFLMAGQLMSQPVTPRVNDQLSAAKSA